MTEQVPFTDVYVDDAIVERVVETIESRRYVKGPRVEELEAQFADTCGVDHAVGVSSGTAALYLTMKAAGIGPGDDVLVPAHTFFATVSPVVELGANPVFVDVDPQTYTMSGTDLAEKAEDAENPEAAVPVHLYGQPAAMDAIHGVADAHDLTVIEDSCQAHGATYRGDPTGSLGDAGCFSFYPSKNMTVAGDGGILVTDDADLARAARELRNHGRDGDGNHVRIGLNHRMNETSAAAGIEQLSHLADWNAERAAAAERYDERLADVDAVELPVRMDDATHVYHLYVVQVPDREGLRAHLDEQGIQTGVHYDPPVHRTPAMREALDEIPSLPVTEELSERIVSLPMHPRITGEEIDRVAAEIRGYYE
ncbi:DegT/DnrJ/EryC1/StrS family aminotransferase [Haloarcula nitratireducens]|uniref:DegT/DnrJ/EryC1/StrS family aminotransferase n=1 Tax=Haloarcula nitratireducens TaxID=2487749 RepID=A0AAW4P890_9EURY|nr:DegT/DnrJ/EryC1/StrS family aminotransferase [Halomicroarcula nitratireducens]MBX0294064.1 DegT/DnrJ/EryC1/StrS family aminotransferase [Halomicroarcula nitratireducens]